MVQKKFIDGPRGLPILGSFLEAKSDMLGFVTRTVEKYGDIARMKIGPMNVYLITHPDYVRHVLMDQSGLYVKSRFYEKLKNILGNGLLNSEGDFWRRQRKLAQPAFHQRYLATLATMMSEVCDPIVERWNQRASTGEVFDVSEDMMELTLDIIVRAMFGSRLKENVSDVRKHMHVILEDTLHRTWAPFAFPLSIPTPRNLRLKRAIAFFDRIIYRIIAEHAQRDDAQQNLLSMLLNARDEATGEGMTPLQVRDEVMTIFMAGHETTATALTWTWYLLSQNPHVAQKLADEFQTVLGGRAPEFSDLPKLVYAKNVLSESMRLFPPVWAISRTATRDHDIDGYAIPRGSMVMMGIYALHHHKAHWKDVESFQPERFQDDQTDRKFIYFPFGGGPRMCIGNAFAMMEGVIILSVLAQRFCLKLVPGHEVLPEAVLTLKPKNGMKMTVRLR